ncbi:hypothetical protein A2G96_09885 [Cupriavidus nantongensis]|uniref:Pilus assembly protein PilO n=2 Tax=Cupriavidus nantongensis TaxID=1796606 RepID=A0A142JIW6_9BURK|nr:hypothetical protein A2G96_09885 [Cupriavidus nantongensis]
MAGVIQLGKRRWVAGMTWASYEDKPNKVELREDAQRLNSTWTAVRIGEDCIQSGFCSAIEGEKVGKLYSLAAMLADSRKQPWLGTFKIADDLWWYVAVRDGHAILPDGDVLGGQEEIYAARDRHSGYTDWNYVDGDLELLETLIKDVDDGPTRISSLDGNPHLPKILAGAAIGLLAAGATGWWLHQQHEQEAAKQRAAMARMREQLAHANLNEKPITSTPATSMPVAAEFLRSCGDAVTLPISQYGWLIDGVSCAVDHATVMWARKDGATVEFRPEGQLSDDGEKVTQTISLSLDQHSKDDRIQLNEAAKRLREWTQAAGFKLDLKPPTNDKKPMTLPGADATAAPPPPPPEQSVSISINISIFDLEIPDIPGLRLSTINMTATGWELIGALYGR